MEKLWLARAKRAPFKKKAGRLRVFLLFVATMTLGQNVDAKPVREKSHIRILIEAINILPANSKHKNSSRLLEERLLVAIDNISGFEASRTRSEDACKNSNSGSSSPDGLSSKNTFYLKVKILPEKEKFSAFISLCDPLTKTVMWRVEKRDIGVQKISVDLSSFIAQWLKQQGLKPGRKSGQKKPTPVVKASDLTIVPIYSGGYFSEGDSLARKLAFQLSSRSFIEVAADKNTPAFYHGDIDIKSFDIITRRHHVRRYLDGYAVATFTIRDGKSQSVLFSSEVVAKTSIRRRKGSRALVRRSLENKLVKQWESKFRSNVIVERMKRNNK